MRKIRKIALLGVLAVAAFAAMASSAFAVTAVDMATGATLAVGSTVNGHSTNALLTGSFLGVTTSVSCSDSTVVGTVKSNANPVAGSIDSLAFTGCKNVSNNNACTVSVGGLPWNPASPGGNAGGLLSTTNTSVNLGTGSNSITISGSSCLPFGTTCSFQGGTAGPLTSGAYSISNYVTGAWSTTLPLPGNGYITISSAGVKSGTCGTGTWTATYELRTGSTITGGDPVGLV